MDRAGDGQGAGDQPLLGAPHLERALAPAASGGSFKLSDDPKFAEKLKERVGLYIDPPADAIVLRLEESQIQALEVAPSPVCR